MKRGRMIALCFKANKLNNMSFGKYTVHNCYLFYTAFIKYHKIPYDRMNSRDYGSLVGRVLLDTWFQICFYSKRQNIFILLHRWSRKHNRTLLLANNLCPSKRLYWPEQATSWQLKLAKYTVLGDSNLQPECVSWGSTFGSHKNWIWDMAGNGNFRQHTEKQILPKYFLVPNFHHTGENRCNKSSTPSLPSVAAISFFLYWQY